MSTNYHNYLVEATLAYMLNPNQKYNLLKEGKECAKEEEKEEKEEKDEDDETEGKAKGEEFVEKIKAKAKDKKINDNYNTQLEGYHAGLVATLVDGGYLDSAEDLLSLAEAAMNLLEGGYHIPGSKEYEAKHGPSLEKAKAQPSKKNLFTGKEPEKGGGYWEKFGKR